MGSGIEAFGYHFNEGTSGSMELREVREGGRGHRCSLGDY